MKLCLKRDLKLKQLEIGVISNLTAKPKGKLNQLLGDGRRRTRSVAHGQGQHRSCT